MCVKNWTEDHPEGDWGYFWDGIATQDFERGRAKDVITEPWQTDDSIGPWGYVADAKHASVEQVIHKLVDIVSKNGNLLLNVPPRADGTLDEPTVAILTGIGAWLKTNGEAIYGTRPFKVYHEGESIRFTTKGDTIYTILLKWPGEDLVLRTLVGEQVKSVEFVGTDAALPHEQTDEGLKITLPKTSQGEHAWALRIEK